MSDELDLDEMTDAPSNVIDITDAPAGRIQRGHDSISYREKLNLSIAMRIGGSSYKQIADALGWNSQNQARAAIVRAMEDNLRDGVRELTNIQFQRYEHMLMLQWPKVQSGDPTATAIALQVMDRENSLMGLGGQAAQAAQQGTVVLAVGTKEEYIAALNKAQALQAEFDEAQAAEQVAGAIDSAPVRDDTDTL